MKTPTAFNWTAEMEAIWPREMRPTASGLLAIWEALHGAAVYDGAPDAPSTDAGRWIAWHGGVCPVDQDTVVEVRFGTPKPYRGEAGVWSWDGEASPADITHYRVVQPAPAADDGWIAHKAGDPCPVPARCYVQFKLVSGYTEKAQAAALDWDAAGAARITHWRHLP